MPGVCVVVPTFCRPAGALRTIAALKAQSRVPDEVVVVDDGSPIADFESLVTGAGTLPAGWTILRANVNAGPATARNIGWRFARSDLVLFTDDDCQPDPDWVAELSRAATDGPASVVQGCTIPDPEPFRTRGPFDHTVRVDRASPMFETCNIAFKRDVLTRLGGFDENFATAFSEDADLGWRAKGAGLMSRFVQSAIVVHDVTPRTFRQRLAGEQRRVSIVKLIVKHPNMRQNLCRGVFYDESHFRLAIALGLSPLILFAPRPLWLPLAACTGYPYLRLRFSWSVATGPRRKWPIWLTQLALADGTDMARLALASVREKALVL